MEMDLRKPIEIVLEKFDFDSNKDDVNPYMVKKLLRRQYEKLGYTVMPGDNFETSLLLEFVKKHRYLDNYIRVKLGEYKPNKGVLEYNKQVLDALGIDIIEKLLFICRICSFIGDPSFPDFIVHKQGESPALRYVYIGDELLPDRLSFVLLSKVLGAQNIKLAVLDFHDYKYPGKMEVDGLKVLEKSLENLKIRANLERSELDNGVDLMVFKKWTESNSVDPKDIEEAYNKFLKRASEPNKTKENLSKLENLDHDILGNGGVPEKLKTLIHELKINMMEAHDLLNLYNIMKANSF